MPNFPLMEEAQVIIFFTLNGLIYFILQFLYFLTPSTSLFPFQQVPGNASPPPMPVWNWYIPVVNISYEGI